jgi:hypothetical protein
MKKILLFLILGFQSFLSISQDLVHKWSGVLNAGGQKIELRLNLIQNADKTYSSNWDIPAQKVKGLASSKTQLLNNQLAVEIKMIGASYSGSLNISGDKVDGAWSQSGMSFPLNMETVKEGQEEKIFLKPQTPKPPFAYNIKDFVYEGNETKLSYGATLTYPNGDKKFPLI